MMKDTLDFIKNNRNVTIMYTILSIIDIIFLSYMLLSLGIRLAFFMVLIFILKGGLFFKFIMDASLVVLIIIVMTLIIESLFYVYEK